MKRYLLMWGLVGSAGLAGAADKPDKPDKPDRPVIDVQVGGGLIKVPEEEAHTNEGHGALVWKLSSPGYAFTSDGIVFDANGRDKLKCGVVGKGEIFRCLKLKHVKGDRYKYTVKLKPTGGLPAVNPLDPLIVSD